MRKIHYSITLFLHQILHNILNSIHVITQIKFCVHRFNTRFQCSIATTLFLLSQFEQFAWHDRHLLSLVVLSICDFIAFISRTWSGKAVITPSISFFNPAYLMPCESVLDLLFLAHWPCNALRSIWFLVWWSLSVFLVDQNFAPFRRLMWVWWTL